MIFAGGQWPSTRAVRADDVRLEVPAIGLEGAGFFGSPNNHDQQRSVRRSLHLRKEAVYLLCLMLPQVSKREDDSKIS